VFEKFGPAEWLNLGLLVVSCFALLAASLAAWAAYRQFKASVQASRATLLKDLYLQFRTDQAAADAFYLIEYGQFRYSEEFHRSSDEPKIDRLLTLCDLVCAMHADGTLTEREMQYFKYQFKRIFGDASIQAYLTFLDDFYARNNMHKKSFEQFQIYCGKL
jgi:hypothetical protein